MQRFMAVLCLCGAACIAKTEELRTVTMAVSDSIAPFFIDSQHGLQYELLEAILQHAHFRLNEVKLAPNYRARRWLENGEVDCLINAPEGIEGAIYTAPYSQFHNVVVSLEASQLTIDKIDDLSSISLVGFQHANRFLGVNFAELTMRHSRYLEVASQRNQVRMLLLGRTQAIVIDENILHWQLKTLQSGLGESKALRFHDLFEPVMLRIACLDPRVVIALNAGIEQIKLQGQQQRIVDSYRLKSGTVKY